MSLSLPKLNINYRMESSSEDSSSLSDSAPKEPKRKSPHQRQHKEMRQHYRETLQEREKGLRRQGREYRQREAEREEERRMRKQRGRGRATGADRRGDRRQDRRTHRRQDTGRYRREEPYRQTRNREDRRPHFLRDLKPIHIPLEVQRPDIELYIEHRQKQMSPPRIYSQLDYSLITDQLNFSDYIEFKQKFCKQPNNRQSRIYTNDEFQQILTKFLKVQKIILEVQNDKSKQFRTRYTEFKPKLYRQTVHLQYSCKQCSNNKFPSICGTLQIEFEVFKDNCKHCSNYCKQSMFSRQGNSDDLVISSDKIHQFIMCSHCRKCKQDAESYMESRKSLDFLKCNTCPTKLSCGKLEQFLRQTFPDNPLVQQEFLKRQKDINCNHCTRQMNPKIRFKTKLYDMQCQKCLAYCQGLLHEKQVEQIAHRFYNKILNILKGIQNQDKFTLRIPDIHWHKTELCEACQKNTCVYKKITKEWSKCTKRENGMIVVDLRMHEGKGRRNERSRLGEEINESK